MAVFKSHEQILLDLLNQAHGKAVPITKLSFRGPLVNDTELVGEVLVVITADSDNKKYKGDTEVAYDKLTFTEIFVTIGVTDLDVAGHAIATTRQMVQAIQDKYEWNILPKDVVDAPIELVDDVAIFDLEAAPDSLFYKGSIQVTYTNDPNIPLSEVIVNTSLNGFDPAQ